MLLRVKPIPHAAQPEYEFNIDTTTGISAPPIGTTTINPKRIESTAFKNFKWIEVEERDSYAANCLAVGNQVIMPAGFQNVNKKIREYGFETIELEMSEFEKADGGITCLSLIMPSEI